MESNVHLLVSGPRRKRSIAAVSSFIEEHEGYILDVDQPKRMAILVSRYEHCLLDLLWRWDAGELHAEIPLVISNHPDLAPRAETYGIPFYHLPVTKETKADQEGEALKLLAEHNVDFVVLARYMQILPPKFIDAYSNRII